MDDFRSVLLIVGITRLTNNTHMEIFIETIRSSIELTAGIGQTVVRQGLPEVLPVLTPDSETGNDAGTVDWRLNQTERPASVEAEYTTKDTFAK